MFNNTKIAARIVLLVAMPVLGIVLLALQGAYTLKSVDHTVEALTKQEFRLAAGSDRLRGAVGNLRRYEKDVFINIASAEKVKAYQERWEKALDGARKSAAGIAGIAAEGRQKELAGQLAKNIESYAAGFAQVAGAIAAGKLRTTAEANEAMEGHKAAVRGMEDLLKELAESIEAGVAAQERQVDAAIGGATRNMVIAVIFILGAAIAVSLLVARSITRPLNAMRRHAQAVAERRDLTLKAPDCGRNEIGEMARDIQSMVESTRGLIEEARRSAEQSAHHAEQMHEISRAVTEASGRQSEATASSAAAIEEFTVSINLVSDTSELVRRDSITAHGEASTGADAARRTAGEIREIAQSIADATEVMASLSKRSQEIGGIVGVIKDIADQTNLLALNAAIEAARAGETGRGFAVVADEVRKLAERTTQATTEISQMIGNVQSDTERANGNMQSAHVRVDQGVASTLKLVGSLEGIGSAAEKMVRSIAEIADALKEQGSASTEIAQKVEQITQMSEENSQAARMAQGHSDDLRDLAIKLNAAIGRFVV